MINVNLMREELKKLGLEEEAFTDDQIKIIYDKKMLMEEEPDWKIKKVIIDSAFGCVDLLTDITIKQNVFDGCEYDCYGYALYMDGDPNSEYGAMGFSEEWKRTW